MILRLNVHITSTVGSLHVKSTKYEIKAFSSCSNILILHNHLEYYLIYVVFGYLILNLLQDLWNTTIKKESEDLMI